MYFNRHDNSQPGDMPKPFALTSAGLLAGVEAEVAASWTERQPLHSAEKQLGQDQ